MAEEGKNWLKNTTTPVIRFDKVLCYIDDLITDVTKKKISAAALQMYVKGLIAGNRYNRTVKDVAPSLAKKKERKK